ncbi:DUF6220 domain-containing protein [Sphaerobacter thermophilus]|uniref:DUF6220 domain-containing protein n=1 Tax=Sphaerobacter thermophilus TaxID=2057 RepID=UPI00235319EA
MVAERRSDTSGTATMPSPSETQERHARADSARGHRSRVAFRILAWLFVGCVLVQVLIAGLAIFDTPLRWSWHENFVHFFEYLPLILLVLAFTGRMPHRVRWLSFGAFALIGLQYAFIGMARDWNMPVIAALHPVNALLIFWVAVFLARSARPA